MYNKQTNTHLSTYSTRYAKPTNTVVLASKIEQLLVVIAFIGILVLSSIVNL